MNAYTIDLKPFIELSDEQFYQLCRNHPELQFERNAQGELIIMPPTGGDTGNRNSEINADLVIWNRRTKLGYCFDSSTGFKLPNGANRSPDLAWISKQRWEALAPQQRSKFPPICPDFVAELMSPTDRLATVQAKMQEYLENGTRLGWLLNPESQTVAIYRQGQAVELLRSPETLSGEDVLPGFSLELDSFW
ncbi:protein of unknown function DUF820 (plasmid) [Thalassoporum mexicanum PCC 7367]|uniref:Uma2 family endonuclease n=1 Tax=Thalassoporum mexicanum TaxID=3457544 RepID=UPI00029FBBBF|nr:Uma2 family endonuclease [Pseudanabaena sp. PCC 7367]AFY72175.1 protein of unknown function DUF820 [Pseudanabaena sp. PCC 7367]